MVYAIFVLVVTGEESGGYTFIYQLLCVSGGCVVCTTSLMEHLHVCWFSFERL